MIQHPAGEGERRDQHHGRCVDPQDAVDQVQDSGLQRSRVLDLAHDLQLDKEPAIKVREPNATTRPAPQDNQLMSQRSILGFKPQL
jgi:hypothetical protein